jgi:hypothetical protein
MSKRKQVEEADTSLRPSKLHKHKGTENDVHELSRLGLEKTERTFENQMLPDHNNNGHRSEFQTKKLMNRKRIYTKRKEEKRDMKQFHATRGISIVDQELDIPVGDVPVLGPSSDQESSSQFGQTATQKAGLRESSTIRERKTEDEYRLGRHNGHVQSTRKVSRPARSANSDKDTERIDLGFIKPEAKLDGPPAYAEGSPHGTAQSLLTAKCRTGSELSDKEEDDENERNNILAYTFPWYSLLEFEAQDEAIAPTTNLGSSALEAEVQIPAAAGGTSDTLGGNYGSSNHTQIPTKADQTYLSAPRDTINLQPRGNRTSSEEEVASPEGTSQIPSFEPGVLSANSPLSFLMLPNSAPLDLRLSCEGEAALIRLHIKPLVNSKAFPYATSTGARKHSLAMGVSPHTSYTTEVHSITSNTGAWKGGWSAGVHPDTSYVGDVMRFPIVDCVHKSIWLEGIAIAECDTPREVVGVRTQIEFVLREVVAQPPPKSSLETPLLAQMTRHPRKAVKLPSTVLRTSDKRTFARGEPLSATPSTSVPSRPPHFDPSSHDPKPQPRTTNEGPKPQVKAILWRGAIDYNPLPWNISQLEDLAKALAPYVNVEPDTWDSILAASGGQGFDLQKEMMLYSRPIRHRDRQSIDHCGMLLGLLNIKDMEDRKGERG